MVALFNDTLEHGFYPGWRRIASSSDVLAVETFYEGDPTGKVWDSGLATLRAPTAAELEAIAGRERYPKVKSLVQLTKTLDQAVGSGNTVNVGFGNAVHNVGGGADTANNRFVCPADKAGFWQVRVELRFTAASVTDGSNYQIGLLQNGVGVDLEDNHSGSGRVFTGRLVHELVLAAGDILTVQLTNLSTGNVTIASGTNNTVWSLRHMGGQ